MGLRGPAAKPTAQKIREGNPGHRPLNRDEPKPAPIAPKCPAWLDKNAKREWRRVAPLLEKLGLLTEVDGVALAGYCQAYARWREAEMILSKEGLTFKTTNGYVQQRPEVSIAQTSIKLVKDFCAQFGLTPSARGRMNVAPAEPGGEDEEFFGC
jgi:P27 family predicted phage terminase small subunit